MWITAGMDQNLGGLLKFYQKPTGPQAQIIFNKNHKQVKQIGYVEKFKLKSDLLNKSVKQIDLFMI